MSKKTFLRMLIGFIIVQAVLSIWIDYTLEVGFDEGSFVFRNVEYPMTIQERITEEFQPDEYRIEKGKPLTIYGSERLYKFFGFISRNPNKAIYAFQLIRMIIIVDILLLVIVYLTKKKMSMIPTKVQLVFEMMYTFFEDLTRETLGKDKLHFTGYVLTIFLFIWTCNMIGIIPFPGFMEPNSNINAPFGMGIMAVLVVHYMSIKHKGFLKYLKGYTEPFFPLAPINFVGEFSKGISISFRLFGNVLGGAIILLVISSLVRFIILPVGLNMFFGLFIGTLQAFVFTMLAMSYIAVEIFD